MKSDENSITNENSSTEKVKKGKIKQFFSDKKNIAITILSILVLLLLSSNNNTMPTSTTELSISEKNNISTQLEESNLQKNYETLVTEKESLQKTLDEKNGYILNLETQIITLTSDKENIQKSSDEKSAIILNLEAQIGALTAEKAQLTAENGVLQEQLNNSKSSSKSSSSSTKSNTQKQTTKTSQDTSATVYITNTGSKYHSGSCSYLRSSKRAISKNSAISQGYTACSRCNP